jgi:hypothetical protein
MRGRTPPSRGVVLESKNNLSESKATAAPRLYVGSEVGTLRRVLLHRPGLELKRLTR